MAQFLCAGMGLRAGLEYSDYIVHLLRDTRRSRTYNPPSRAPEGRLLEAFLQGGARLWCPRRRLAAAPGRFARPAPPGNDDPCVVWRTISEGMPRRRQGIGEQLTTASTGPGQKSHVERRKASVPSLGTQDASRKAGLAWFAQIDRTPGPPVVRYERKAGSPGLRISRGVCASVMTRRDGCLACIRAPPALRTL